MQLPVDVKALIDEMTNIRAARETELSLSVFIDSTAPADLVAYVRGAFASSSPALRLTISYLDATFAPHAGDDMAVLVAGTSRTIGAAAAAIRATGTPVAVITTSPALVGSLAEQGGHAIPEGDLVFPADAEPAHEPLSLDDSAKEQLDARLGRWVAAIAQDRRLAFALAFPFLRRPLATDAVQATSLQNAGVGLVPLIPGADLPIMTLNQAKMVLQIAAVYGHDMDKERAKELAAVVGSAYACRTLARELAEFVPVLGFVWRTGIAYGGTSALGHAIIEYFEGGQDAAGLANVASQASKTASTWATAVRDDPAAVVNEAVGRVKQVMPVVRDKIDEYVPKVTGLVSEYAPRAREAVAEYAPRVKQAVAAAVRA